MNDQPDRSNALLAQRLMAALQRMALHYFGDELGLEQVFPPLIVPNPGMETTLDAFRVSGPQARAADGGFLHTSPEFAIKAALPQLCDTRGAFATTRVFRAEPLSEKHCHEFTMLEWYRFDADYRDLVGHCVAFLRVLAAALPDVVQVPHTKEADVLALRAFCEMTPTVLTMSEAMALFAGISPDAYLEPAPPSSVFSGALRRADIDHDADWPADALESVVYAELVEPALGDHGISFVTEFPVRHAALARRSLRDPRVAERLEFYLPFRTQGSPTPVGLELANGYSELTDVAEQRDRFEAMARANAARGVTARPFPEYVLQGLADVDRLAGMALGLDRLAMFFAQRLYGVWLSPRDFLFGAVDIPER